MIRIAVRAVPMAAIMMMLSGIYTLETFVLGFLIGYAILALVEGDRVEVNPRKLPGQFVALMWYLGLLLVDIVRSGFDVARRVLRPTMDISPGVIAVHTQDESNNGMISALSAHGITITPGEMVIDFLELENRTVMYVHALDEEDSRAKAKANQTKRLKTYRRILGLD